MTSDAPLDLDAQIQLLRGRGMRIHDDDRAFLYDSNYYRLSVYWRNFQVAPSEGDDSFEGGTEFSQVQNIYRFERVLRSVLIDGLLVVEMTLRARMAFEIAHSREGAGVFAYLNPDYYKAKNRLNPRTGLEQRAELLEGIAKEIDRSKDLFIDHYRRADRPIPVWAGLEVISFGNLSKIYSLVDDKKVRSDVSKSFKQPSTEMMETNLHALSILRNICAHGGRLWNAKLMGRPSIKAKLMELHPHFENNSVYARIVVLLDLLESIDHNSFQAESIKAVLEDFSEYLPSLTHPKLK